MGLDGSDDAPEHGGRDDVHFIQQDEPPFLRLQERHHFLGLGRPRAVVGYHRVSRHHDTSITGELINRVISDSRTKDRLIRSPALSDPQ